MHVACALRGPQECRWRRFHCSMPRCSRTDRSRNNCRSRAFLPIRMLGAGEEGAPEDAIRSFVRDLPNHRCTLRSAVSTTLHDLVLIPEPAPDNKAIAISLPPDQAAEAQRAAEDAERAAHPVVTFPMNEDSGVVVSAATKAPSEPVAQRRRVWPWILLVLVILALCAAWYLYFIEGVVPDLDAF